MWQDRTCACTHARSALANSVCGPGATRRAQRVDSQRGGQNVRGRPAVRLDFSCSHRSGTHVQTSSSSAVKILSASRGVCALTSSACAARARYASSHSVRSRRRHAAHRSGSGPRHAPANGHGRIGGNLLDRGLGPLPGPPHLGQGEEEALVAGEAVDYRGGPAAQRGGPGGGGSRHGLAPHRRGHAVFGEALLCAAERSGGLSHCPIPSPAFGATR